MSIKLCKNFWLTTNEDCFVLTRMRKKSDELYRAELKAAVAEGKRPTSVKRIAYLETFYSSLPSLIRAMWKYKLLNNEYVQETTPFIDGTSPIKPANAKSLKKLLELVKQSEESLIEELKESFDGIHASNIRAITKNEQMAKTIKRLKALLTSKGIPYNG